MKRFNFAVILTVLLFCLSAIAATDNSGEALERIIDKGYRIYALDAGFIYLVDGTKKYKKVSFREFYKPKKIQKKFDRASLTKIRNDLKYYRERGFEIALAKEDAFYLWKDEKVERYDPIKDLKRFGVAPPKKKTVELTHCRFCSFKFSFNRISILDESQNNFELAWLPYLRLSPNSGISFSQALSPYRLEDNNLNDTMGFGLKSQALYRIYLRDIFVEAGAGAHVFLDYQSISPMGTIGAGYTFQTKHWLFTPKVTFSGVFLHYSTIAWDEQIEELKLGIGLNF